MNFLIVYCINFLYNERSGTNVKKGILERAAEATDLPKDLVMNMPRIVLLGDREIEVNNYKGLLEYSTQTIRLAIAKKQIVISGDDLHIDRLDVDTIFVSGSIFKIEFCQRNKKNPTENAQTEQKTEQN